MRKLIKNILPKSIVVGIRKIKLFYYHGFRLLKFYYRDYRRYSQSGFKLSSLQTQENLRSRITFYYHSIEKGLSHPKIRLGFGKRALSALFSALEEYKSSGFDLNDIRFRTGISTIQTYIDFHKGKEVDISDVITRYASLGTFDKELIGGAEEFDREKVLERRETAFNTFSKYRISVRDYADSSVNKEIINEALKLSMNAPSVCNRQSWRVYVISDKAIQDSVLIAQAGLNGFGQNIQSLIMITSDLQSFSGPEERNQAFVDGGIYAMNLLYSLEFVGLASCALNANLKMENEAEIRKVLNIPDNEVIIMFISVGNYPESFKAPKSQRDDYAQITRYF